MSGVSELWLKHRPSTFDEVIGQDSAVKVLKNFFAVDSVPHAILLHGPSGTGKSTLAHIIANELGCSGMDKVVVNCATADKPLEVVKSLEAQARLSPAIKSKNRSWILEEMQSLTRSSSARQAILMMLESSSRSTRKSYFIGCTTEPEKLDLPIRGRCKKIELVNIKDKDLKEILCVIAGKEKKALPESVANKIIREAGGSAREAVNQLDSAFAAGPDEGDMLSAVTGMKDDDKAYGLIKVFFWTKPEWNAVTAIIKEINDDPEQFRRRVLSIAAKEMIKGGKNAKRAYMVHGAFKYSWTDCPRTGLVAACWEVLNEILS